MRIEYVKSNCVFRYVCVCVFFVLVLDTSMVSVCLGAYVFNFYFVCSMSEVLARTIRGIGPLPDKPSVHPLLSLLACRSLYQQGSYKVKRSIKNRH